MIYYSRFILILSIILNTIFRLLDIKIDGKEDDNKSHNDKFVRRYINYLWDSHGISSFESLKSNPNIDRNDLVAIKMIERYDLIKYCRETFYKTIPEDNKLRAKILINRRDRFYDRRTRSDDDKLQHHQTHEYGNDQSNYETTEFRKLSVIKENNISEDKFPSEKEDNSSELYKYKGFEDYVRIMCRKYKILYKQTLTEITKEEQESFSKDFDICVSYVWNSDKIFNIYKLRCSGTKGTKEEERRCPACNTPGVECLDFNDKLWNKMLCNIDNSTGKWKVL